MREAEVSKFYVRLVQPGGESKVGPFGDEFSADAMLATMIANRAKQGHVVTVRENGKLVSKDGSVSLWVEEEK